jgi:hypothetical protein
MNEAMPIQHPLDSFVYDPFANNSLKAVSESFNYGYFMDQSDAFKKQKLVYHNTNFFNG